MSRLFGKYECKVDSKGRFIFPAGLKKLLPESEATEFALVKEKEGYLVLYTKASFDKKLDELDKLDDYVDVNDEYKREFFDTVAVIPMDSAMRLNLPNEMMEEVSINKDIILLGVGKKIELWAAEKYPKSSTARQAELKKQIVFTKPTNQ